MYRHRLNEKQLEDEWFVSRMCELPVVNSAVGQLTALYSGVKQHNRLFRFTLNTAEGGMNVVVQTARPVLSKFEKPIGSLNTMACQQLDKFEHDYPIITKPTEEVLKETKDLCVSAVQPLVSRVGAVKQYGVDSVSAVKTCAGETLTGVKGYGVSTLNAVSDVGTKQMTRALESSVGRHSVTQLDMILDVADRYVDTYLPEAEEDDNDDAVEKQGLDNDERLKATVVMVKAAHLGNKVRRRMYGHISCRLRNAKLRTKESVERLHFTVDLIEYSRGMMNSTVDKAMYVWTEINKSEEQVARELTEEDAETRIHTDSTYERRAIATARHLNQKMKHTMSSIGLPLDKLPEMMRPVCDLASAAVTVPATNLSALGRHTVCVFGQYHVFITEKCSAWLGWVIGMTPVTTVVSSRAPDIGTLVSSGGSERSPSAKPIDEIPLMEYSSSDGPDDDCPADED